MNAKTLKCGALFGALIIGWFGTRANAQPTIFNWTESANPGDVIALQGDSFGNSPQVWMLHVTGTESTLMPTEQITVVSGTGSLNTTGSNSLLSAVIPDTETPGLYAIWVSADSGSTFSTQVYVNAAIPWNADDLCGTMVDPGRHFHIYGRNLQLSGTVTPTVNFVSTTGTLAASVTSGTDPYALSVTAPSGLQGGVNYTLTVNNGFGGNYGLVYGPALTGTITSGSDPYGIGVPWGADFASYPSNVYPVPYVSATTNMTAAIQTAINAVSGSGGGVVTLQSGTYQLLSAGDCCLVLKSHTVIQGAGMNQTVLLMTGTSILDPIGYHYGVYDNGRPISDVGFADLTIYNTVTGGQSNLSLTSASNDRIFAVRAQLQSDVENNVNYSGSQMVVADCNIISGTGVPITTGTVTKNDILSPIYFTGVNDVVLRNNFIQYYNGRIQAATNGASGVLFQGNTMSMVAFSIWLGETGGLDVQQSQDTVAIGNVFQRDPTLSGTYNFPNGNDGETILNQTGVCKYPCHGNVSSATSITLTDTNQNWTNNYAAPAPDDYQMYYVTIIDGPGTGQIREVISNGTNSLTVDSPWQVIPATGSVYSVNHLESLRHLIKDNILSNGMNGIEYYSVNIKDTAIVNNTLYNSGGIWLRSDYQPVSNEFDVQINDLVAGNSVTCTLSDPYARTDSYAWVRDELCVTGTVHAPGTQTFCAEFRDNTVTAPVPNKMTGTLGEGFGLVATQISDTYPISDGTTEASIGVIFQNNTAVSCSNGFHLCTGDYYTSLWNNLVSGSGCSVLLDGTGSGISHGSLYNSYGYLTGFWTFNGQNGNDSSGNNNNGTLVKNPTFTTDVPFTSSSNTYSITFSGSNSVQVPNAPSINPVNDFTVGLWMKSGTNSDSTYCRIVSKDGKSTTSPGWEITRGDTGSNEVTLRLDSSAGVNQTYSMSGACTNSWHYVAYVVAGSTVYGYLDGSLLLTHSCKPGTGFGNSSLPLLMGVALGGSSDYYYGELDEVQIYDCALTGTEVMSLYQNPQ